MRRPCSRCAAIPRCSAQPAVAIVGSRAASAYGLEVARRVAGELAEAGLVIVSGLAFGIDAAAHEAALAAGGRTVAIQACGLDRVYPAAHRGLAARIARSGAVATEFALGVAPQPAFFPLRNRLISGLARALVVVEARERSGSLVTARHAADQGIDVFAVPGPITEPNHVGSQSPAARWRGAAARHRGRAVGARVARRAAAPRARACASPRAPARSSTRCAARPRAVTSSRGGSAAAPSELAPPLLELELAGPIARDRDGRWRALAVSVRGCRADGTRDARSRGLQVVVHRGGARGLRGRLAGSAPRPRRRARRDEAGRALARAPRRLLRGARVQQLAALEPPTSAVGLLKEEMRRLGSLVIAAADESGGAGGPGARGRSRSRSRAGSPRRSRRTRA